MTEYTSVPDVKFLKKLPLTSSHWGTYRAEVSDGKAKILHPFEMDDEPSAIGSGILDVQDGPTRITHPMVRKSWLESGPSSNPERRGVDPFIAVSWDTANRLVADELQRVKATFSNKAIYAGSYGWSSAGRFHHAQSQIHRFLNCAGGYTRSVNSYSLAAGEVLLPHVMGQMYDLLSTTTSWPSIIKNTRLFVAFGGVPLKNGQINSGGVGRHIQRENLVKARDVGIEFVNVSPIRGDVEEEVKAEWFAPRPGTDVAILLGIAHTLYTRKLYKKHFLERCTVGFERFVPYLMGGTDGIVKDVNWASKISGLDGKDIEMLARRMASTRTMISVSWALTRQDHGEQPFWAAIAVAAMLGQIGLPGGGLGFGYSATNSVGDQAGRLKSTALPQGINQVKDFIPVARISDMLLNPGGQFEYNGQQLTYPDIRLIYWAGGNPFHHHQDLNRMVKAWRKPETVIVHEWSWNTLAKHADIVLPCTTPLEREDMAFSPRDPYVVAMQKVSNKPEHCRDDYDILRGIAKKMGMEHEFTGGRCASEWIRWIYDTTRDRAKEKGVQMPSYDKIREDGWYKVPVPEKDIITLDDFCQDPDAHPLPTKSGKIEIFSSVIDGFDYDDCPGHPSWMEPCEWLGNATQQYPIHLISNQPVTRLHSQLDHGSHSRRSKIKGREPVLINSVDAEQRGITDGDVVRIFNDRGACLAGVIIDDQVRPNVIQLSTGAWFDPQYLGVLGSLCKHGNPNVLTLDKGTSRLAQGPSAHSCLVQVERYIDEPPAVTAFTPPEIIFSDPVSVK
ncbi:MAG: molybdopterin-dependent oxidoreductase [Gammaproteobacteria bacterium]|nr:molybdopterin-dependent oxidoreductase [Gammaproteobacteria bacterium]